MKMVDVMYMERGVVALGGDNGPGSFKFVKDTDDGFVEVPIVEVEFTQVATFDKPSADDDDDILETMWILFNTPSETGERGIRSMMVGDEVAISDNADESNRVYTVASFGFIELDD